MGELLQLFRPRLRGIGIVAVLISVSSMASLFEPWIYRAIIDDIAGVFAAPDPLDYADRAMEDVVHAIQHLPASVRRMFSAPLQTFAGPDDQRRELESTTPQEAIATVLVGAALLLLMRLFSEWCALLGEVRATKEANAVERGFILRTFQRVTELPMSYFALRSSSAVARQVDQADQISPVFSAVSKEVWSDLFSLAVILTILVSVNHGLALLSMVVVPVYGYVTWRMTRALNTDVEPYFALWDEVSSRIQQTVAGITTVQAHGAGDHEVRQLRRLSGRAYNASLRLTGIESRFAFIQNSIIGAAKAGVLACGGVRALEHQLTPGDVVLFLAYLDRLYDPIERLTGLYTSLQPHLASLRRAQRLLAQPAPISVKRPALAAGPGEVEFDHVSFAYDDRQPVLADISFRIAAGEHVALVGASGAGKSTIANLLAGLYVPRSGVIRIDGQPLDSVSSASIHAAVRTVAVDGMLFRDTIRANVRYGAFDATPAEVQGAAQAAGLAPVLARMPHGLDTEVGEGGVALSAGERQRVLMARAFLAKPRVLVVDEATANLDYRTEAAVKKALAALTRERTTLLIAHRPSMIADADRVLVLAEGSIAQQGSPAQLLESPGYFRDMLSRAANQAALVFPGQEKRPFLRRASNVEQDLQNDVDFQQARS